MQKVVPIFPLIMIHQCKAPTITSVLNFRPVQIHQILRTTALTVYMWCHYMNSRWYTPIVLIQEGRVCCYAYAHCTGALQPYTWCGKTTQGCGGGAINSSTLFLSTTSKRVVVFIPQSQLNPDELERMNTGETDSSSIKIKYYVQQLFYGSNQFCVSFP